MIGRKKNEACGKPFLNLAAFQKNTRMVGPGIRDALWVQGCSIRCPGCANIEYLSHEKRVLVSVERLMSHFFLRRNRIDGCTILGGEPTEQAREVSMLLQGVKSMGLSTVVFTGRKYEDLVLDGGFNDLLSATDLLIDGPFIAELHDPDLHWRGSANQRLIPLSHRFGKKDLEPSGPNGELIISEKGILAHGIGTSELLKPDKINEQKGTRRQAHKPRMAQKRKEPQIPTNKHR